jgi:hypothetical protein
MEMCVIGVEKMCIPQAGIGINISALEAGDHLVPVTCNIEDT